MALLGIMNIHALMTYAKAVHALKSILGAKYPQARRRMQFAFAYAFSEGEKRFVLRMYK